MRPLRFFAIAFCGVLLACTEQPESGKAAVVEGGAERSLDRNTTLQQPLFLEKASDVGLVFQHYTGASGEYHMPEILGSGVALFDADNDGDLDVYFVQGTDLDENTKTAGRQAVNPSPGSRLFANRLVETGHLQFDDVTEQVELTDTLYGMGVAVSDYDNDGDADLYVAGYVDNALYKNNGGTFEKIPDAGGAQDLRWSSSATFCDINRDHWPDLYIANYLNYSPTQKLICRDSLGQEDYCSPKSYSAAPDSVFINNRDGTFSDAREIWGVSEPAGAGLGVLCRDLNLDGYVDIYVANDSMANNLWINDRGGRLLDNAAMLGAALNINGLPEGSMGITAGDFDFDGDDDLFLTHWNNETNTLYRNDLARGFLDITTSVNLASASYAHTGFGSGWLDFDNDGDLDLFVANGAVQRYVDAKGQLSSDYGQANQLFQNDKQRFTEISERAFGSDLSPATSRGTAFGDIDNDGDTDIVVTNKDGLARLYLNQLGSQRSWFGLRLAGTNSERDAIGAVVTLTLADGRIVRRVVRRDGSYQSANDPRIIIGLGTAVSVPDVEVSWPAGGTQVLKNPGLHRFHTVVEGAGQDAHP